MKGKFRFFLIDVSEMLTLLNFFNPFPNKSWSPAFSPFPKVFQKPSSLTHSHTMTPFDAPGKQAF